ncbi:DUF4238 domain-containing protein [Achromobacter sp. CF-sbj1-Ac2-l]|uniref:DUF4238 domain-containing protein n=1 Tax=Achromobacter dolens TaxID=1287738 RepID=A0A6S7CEG2_9BURK|nr:DUF4238 domain-containing protein [Achromobacter dolens]CAB3845078.1 hypothetical protein LMG26841_01661 [Achromobacter dolens]
MYGLEPDVWPQKHFRTKALHLAFGNNSWSLVQTMKTSTQLRVDNHYVPQLYLKQWAKNGKIPTYRLLVPKNEAPLWKDHSLRGIAYHQHLYTYVAGQEETDELEHWLSKEFEDPAQEAIRLVVNDERMSPEHWRRLIRFAVAQDVRTPASLRAFLARHRDSMQGLLNQTVESSVKYLEAAVKAGIKLPERAPDWEPTESFPVKISVVRNPEGDGTIETRTILGRRLWLWSVRHVLTETITKITNQRWTIVHAPAGVSWPTSDNPLIRLNYRGPASYSFGGGWGVDNVDILMPISPTHLLHNCIGRRSWPRGTVLDQATAQFLRKVIIEHADRYVFDISKSDVQKIRRRTVNLAAYNEERAIWQNWGKEQGAAEAELF